jgi:hypothetical protein
MPLNGSTEVRPLEDSGSKRAMDYRCCGSSRCSGPARMSRASRRKLVFLTAFPCGSMAMIPCRLAPRRLRGGLGSNLRGPRDMPAVSSRLRRPHRAPIYPYQPLPRPSRFGCGLLGSSSFCPKMNGAVLSTELSCWFAPNLTTGRGIRASARWQMYVCQAAISKPCSRGPDGTGPPSQTTEKPGCSGKGRFRGARLDDR